MSDRPRYVFDAITVVSALLFEQSVPGRALSTALDRGVILISQDVLDELSDVLGRPKFDKYLTRDEREQFLRHLIRESIPVEVSADVRACRDPKDDKYLALAVAGRAACLVSGDRDLLVLPPFRGIPILSPADFLASATPDAQ